MPAGRKNPEHVGVPRRRIKALRKGRRQQRCRQAGKILSMLACHDGGQRLCGEVSANKDVGKPEKSWACWRATTEDKGFARRRAPTCSCPSLRKECLPYTKRQSPRKMWWTNKKAPEKRVIPKTSATCLIPFTNVCKKARSSVSVAHPDYCFQLSGQVP